jgi:hypothetical protein
MIGSSKASRQPPPRRFENYVLNRVVDTSVGLSTVSDNLLVQVSGPAPYDATDPYQGAGAGVTDDATSDITQIGFDFQLDNIVYKSWVASTKGWLVLVDPTTGTFVPNEVFNTTDTFANGNIRASFTSNAVLLCPWFDNLRNSASIEGQLGGVPFNYSFSKFSRIKNGLETPPPYINPSSFGISYYTETNSAQGRRLIVRWASLSDHNSPSSLLRFEIIIYENGTIEYRYAPRAMIAAPTVIEGATIGIFMPNGSNRFRDCSTGLGYRDGSRQEYIYGGYTYDASYLDVPVSGSEDYSSGYTSPVPYSINLLPYRHWPALNTGCIIRLSPPRNRRRILPRSLIRTLDSDVRLPQATRVVDDGRVSARSFDDRLSPNYTMSDSHSTVNYPTTMPRFFGGNGLGVTERQDLFTGDMLVTGSVIKSAIDQYVVETSKQQITPFNETRTPEQTELTDPFYMTGSGPEHLSDGFEQGLRSKTIIRFVMPVQFITSMPGTTSSIYYYNSVAKTWQVPARSTYVLGSTGSRPPSPNPYAGGDWTNSITDVVGGRFIEDAKGFGPVGNIISSGSNTPVFLSDQTDPSIGASYDQNSFSEALSKTYSKSVRNNPQYAPSENETFKLPINGPFLLEKAVFEIPISFGPGWFADQTTCFSPLGSNSSFDFAGPALTLALMRQVKLSKTQPELSIRDLIMTGTITHQVDTTSSLVMSNFPPDDSTFQLRPVGFNSYGGPPSTIISGTNSQYTGSIPVPMVSAISVGAMVRFIKGFDTAPSGTLAAQIRSFMATPTITLADSIIPPVQNFRYLTISPFGRGGAAMQPSGRSILGNEFATLQGLSDPSGISFPNPFYTGSLTAQQDALLSQPPTASFAARATSVLPLVTNYPSPYLLMPDDQLVLSISKTRPAVYKYGDVTMQNSASISHDVRLVRGRIYVTLYGCQVQAGKERHDGSTQAVGSNTVHEIIGGDPILDQFDVGYRNEYTGSFTDNVMLGSLTQTTTRDRKLSRLNARLAPPLTTNITDTQINPYKSYRVQQWWERDGSVRLAQFMDPTERYWDSMMPGVNECFSADGCGVFVTPPGSFGDFRQVDPGSTGSISTFNPKRNHPGWIMMDNLNPSLVSSYNAVINGNWNRSYPFEPRYQGVSRQLDSGRSLVATYTYQPTSSPVVSPITPTPVDGLILGTTGLGTSVLNFTLFGGGVSYIRNSQNFDWFVDCNLTSKLTNNTVTPTIPASMYPTGTMNAANTNRVLFGFGDRNTCYQVTNQDGTKSLLGTNHFIDSRDVEGPHPDGYQTYFDSSNFRYAPLIRGWKYGVYNGNASYSRAYWRRNRFGQFRDMLEQRPFTKFFRLQVSGSLLGLKQGVQPAAVTVNFLDPTTGHLTAPDNTWSSNLHFECTSSMPFFDGVVSNRPPIISTTLNLHPSLVRRDAVGNIHIG